MEAQSPLHQQIQTELATGQLGVFNRQGEYDVGLTLLASAVLTECYGAFSEDRSLDAIAGRLQSLDSRLAGSQITAMQKTHQQSMQALFREGAEASPTLRRKRPGQRRQSIALPSSSSPSPTSSSRSSSSSQETGLVQPTREPLGPPSTEPLTAEEFRTLSAMHPFLTKGSSTARATPEQLQAFAQVLLKSRGNPEVNRQMKMLLDESNGAAGGRRSRRNSMAGVPPLLEGRPHSDVCRMLRDFSFRTGYEGNLLVSAEKTQTLVDTYFKAGTTPPSQRQSLHEIGGVLGMWKCAAACDLIRELHLDQVDSTGELAMLAAAEQRSDMVSDQIEAVLNRDPSCRPGDLFSDNPHRIATLRNQPNISPSHAQQLKVQGASVDAVHSAIVMSSETKDHMGQTQMRLSHVVQNYVQSDFRLSDRLSSTGVRVDPVLLLNPDFDNDLRMVLVELLDGQGTSLDSELRRVFEQECHAIHTEVDFSEVVNSDRRRHVSGLTSLLGPLGKKIGARPRSSSISGLRERASSRADQPEKSPEMICSEFCARSLLAAVETTQERLFDQLAERLQQVDPSKTQEEHRARLQGMTLLRNPIPDNERLATVNPGALIDLLGKANCIRMVEPEPLVRALVQEQDLAAPAFLNLCKGVTIGGEALFSPRAPGASCLVKASEVTVLEGNPFAAPAKKHPLHGKWATAGVDPPRARLEKMPGENVFTMVRGARETITEKLTETKDFLAQNPLTPEQSSLLQGLEDGSLQLRSMSGGTGSSFAVIDDQGRRVALLKPNDTGPLELHNAEGNASCLPLSRVRASIPLYERAASAALCSELNQMLGLDATNEAFVAITSNLKLPDITDGMKMKHRGGKSGKAAVFKRLGKPAEQRVISVQDFLVNSVPMESFIHDLELRQERECMTFQAMQGVIRDSISQENFEQVLLFCCLTGETDGNWGNFHLQAQGEGADVPFKLIKIDNDETWPQSNRDLHTSLMDLELLLERPLTEGTKERIRQLPEEQIVALLKKYQRPGSAIDATQQRVQLLQTLVQYPHVTAGQLLESLLKGEDLLNPDRPPEPTAEELMMAAIAGTPRASEEEP